MTAEEHSVLVEGDVIADLLEVCGLDGGTPYGLLVTFVDAGTHSGELLRDALIGSGEPIFVADVPGGGIFIFRRAR